MACYYERKDGEREGLRETGVRVDHRQWAFFDLFNILQNVQDSVLVRSEYCCLHFKIPKKNLGMSHSYIVNQSTLPYCQFSFTTYLHPGMTTLWFSCIVLSFAQVTIKRTA